MNRADTLLLKVLLFVFLSLLPRFAFCDEAWWTALNGCVDKKKSVIAAFKQETVHRSGVVGAQGEGELLATSGGRLRMSWSYPPGQTLYVDGQSVFMVRPDLNATVMSSLSREPLAQSILALLNADIAALQTEFAFRVIPSEAAAEDAPVVVSLSPRTKVAGIEEILIVLEPGCPALRRIVVLDSAGAAIRITFTRVVFDAKIPRNAFQVPKAAKRRIIRP